MLGIACSKTTSEKMGVLADRLWEYFNEMDRLGEMLSTLDDNDAQRDEANVYGERASTAHSRQK